MPPVVTNAANRLGLDYRAEARRLANPPIPIFDVHTHINGTAAAEIYRDAADLYGIAHLVSMTRLENVPAVRDILGDRVRFISVPDWSASHLLETFTTDWLSRIERFAALGCRICKFWTAPRALDLALKVNHPDLFSFDGEWRQKAMTLARDRGMMFMAHVADPDTWFATKYRDAGTYGTKRAQYEPFERALDQFSDVPWIAAHMGGSPENLDFLDDLLARHPNLHLDTSATKWMVRELSRHPRRRLVAFLQRWRGRILFGSDIVTMDDHLRAPGDGDAKRPGVGELASTRDEAFDLYASRYWAQRTMWETDYDGESPIADPDLTMVEPDKFDSMSAPRLRGFSLPPDLLRELYHDAADRLVGRWHRKHP